jgi:hypothetical protein
MPRLVGCACLDMASPSLNDFQLTTPRRASFTTPAACRWWSCPGSCLSPPLYQPIFVTPTWQHQVCALWRPSPELFHLNCSPGLVPTFLRPLLGCTTATPAPHGLSADTSCLKPTPLGGLIEAAFGPAVTLRGKQHNLTLVLILNLDTGSLPIQGAGRERYTATGDSPVDTVQVLASIRLVAVRDLLALLDSLVLLGVALVAQELGVHLGGGRARRRRAAGRRGSEAQVRGAV